MFTKATTNTKELEVILFVSLVSFVCFVPGFVDTAK